jgi:hypothetical protein
MIDRLVRHDKTTTDHDSVRAMRPMLQVGCCLALLAATAGCDALTDVETDLVVGEDLENAEGALTLRAGAFRQFADALRVGVSETGVFTDELIMTDPANRTDVLDTRSATEQDPGSSTAFTWRQEALEFIDQAITGMRRHAPEPSARVGDLYALRGYTLVLLAEHFCSGVPTATFEDGRPAPGVPHTTDELLDLALAAFDTATALAGDAPSLVGWAAVGQGRALLNQGRFADAAGAVAGVPTDFSREIEYSAETFQLWNQVSSAFPLRTVADGEGNNGLPFVSLDDPRLDLQPAGVQGGQTSLRPSKYVDRGTPIVLASGPEARLIEAEAALQANESDTWLGIHNTLRATLDLPPLTDPGTPAERVDLHFQERALWLFLTGHRLGDLRRLVRQYDRTPDATYPAGPYKGGPETYGSATTFPVPEGERANPNFQGCLPEQSP